MKKSCYSRKIPFRRRDGKVYGYFESEIFRKSVSLKSCLYRKLDAWAFDKPDIERLKTLDCRFLVVKDRDEKTTYRVTFERFLSLAETIDEGCGEQLALPRKFWKQEKTGCLQLSLLGV